MALFTLFFDAMVEWPHQSSMTAPSSTSASAMPFVFFESRVKSVATARHPMARINWLFTIRSAAWSAFAYFMSHKDSAAWVQALEAAYDAWFLKWLGSRKEQPE